MNQLERHLVERLRDKLAPKFNKIEIHRKPSASRSVTRYLQCQLGYVPLLQPELDMVLWSNYGVFAVEVKVFGPSTGSQRHSFYEGIGQALALHRFGFDYVALWFLFLNTPTDDLNRHGAEAWWLVRHDLKLSLDFEYFQVEPVDGTPDDFRFWVMQYDDRQEGHRVREIDDPSLRIRFKHANPAKNELVPKTIRRAIDLWFSGSLKS